MKTRRQQEKAVVRDIQNLCFYLWKRYNRTADFDSFFSEALFWAAKRWDKLIEDRSVNEQRYRKYISVSITRLVERYYREQLISEINLRNGQFTVEKVKVAIKNNQEWAVSKIAACCTERQAMVLTAYIESKSLREVADQLGVTTENAYYHLQAGVQNIVVKNQKNYLDDC